MFNYMDNYIAQWQEGWTLMKAAIRFRPAIQMTGLLRNNAVLKHPDGIPSRRPSIGPLHKWARRSRARFRLGIKPVNPDNGRQPMGPSMARAC